MAVLAKRPEGVYAPVRTIYDGLLKELLKVERGEDVIGALTTAYAANPEGTRSIIPELLDHVDPKWGKAAVQILYEQAIFHAPSADRTRDAVTLLLEQQNKPLDHFVRTEAARRICQLLSASDGEKRRGPLIQMCADRLPEIAKDLSVWPMESEFPGRIALPIIEALRREPLADIPDPAIRIAVEISNYLRNASGLSSDSKMKRRAAAWRNAVRDHKVENWMRGLSLGFSLIMLGVAVLLGVIASVLSVHGAAKDRMYAISSEWALVEVEQDAIRSLKNLVGVASRIDVDLSRKHVLVHGAGQYRTVETIYASTEDAFQHRRLSDFRSLDRVVSSDSNLDERFFQFLTRVKVSTSEIVALRAALSQADLSEVRSGMWRESVFIPPLGMLEWKSLRLFLFVAFPSLVGLVYVFYSPSALRKKVWTRLLVGASLLISLLGAEGILLLAISDANSWLRFFPALLAIAGLLLTVLIVLPARMHWNGFIDVVNHVRVWRHQ